jgi:hypothetical protein
MMRPSCVSSALRRSWAIMPDTCAVCGKDIFQCPICLEDYDVREWSHYTGGDHDLEADKDHEAVRAAE